MKKEDKTLAIEKIAATLKEYSCFYLVESASLDAEMTSALRRACFKNDIKLMVVKNTLLQKALETLDGDYSEIYPALAGPTSLMCANVGSVGGYMLVSKIKPCMPKFKCRKSETTKGSLGQPLFTKDRNPTWITVAILELIHAPKLRLMTSAPIRLKPIEHLPMLVVLVTPDSYS